MFVELSCKEPNLLGRFSVPSYHNSTHMIGCGWSPCVMPARGGLMHRGREKELRREVGPHFGASPKYSSGKMPGTLQAEGAQPSMLERSNTKFLYL